MRFAKRVGVLLALVALFVAILALSILATSYVVVALLTDSLPF